jgi:hypothetical protein
MQSKSMLARQIEMNLIEFVKGNKSLNQIKPSLDTLQGVLTPPLEPGIGFVGGHLAIKPGHQLKFSRGVLGPAVEYAGYNDQGQFFASPTSGRGFFGIPFNDGTSNVIISDVQAKGMLKQCCKDKLGGLSELKRTQLGGMVSNIKNFMKTLVIYGEYKTHNGDLAEGVDLGEAFFGFIEDVLMEYNTLNSQEKIKYKKKWDLMAHGYDSNPQKWKQKKFKNLSQEVKDSFDDDDNIALTCRLVKDAIYCFDHNVDKVDDGHTHYFNSLLDKVEQLSDCL